MHQRFETITIIMVIIMTIIIINIMTIMITRVSVQCTWSFFQCNLDPETCKQRHSDCLAGNHCELVIIIIMIMMRIMVIMMIRRRIIGIMINSQNYFEPKLFQTTTKFVLPWLVIQQSTW